MASLSRPNQTSTIPVSQQSTARLLLLDQSMNGDLLIMTIIIQSFLALNWSENRSQLVRLNDPSLLQGYISSGCRILLLRAQQVPWNHVPSHYKWHNVSPRRTSDQDWSLLCDHDLHVYTNDYFKIQRDVFRYSWPAWSDKELFNIDKDNRIPTR